MMPVGLEPGLMLACMAEGDLSLKSSMLIIIMIII
jgi:hypothetical protein